MLTPRKQPRQQRSRETVAAILEAAAQLFQRYGYAGTTTNKIAERAGVSIGSLYQYFPNKDSLLVALAEHYLAESGEQVARVFARAAEQRPSLPELLTGLVGCVADLHTDRPALHRLLFDQAPPHARAGRPLPAGRAADRRRAGRRAAQARGRRPRARDQRAAGRSGHRGAAARRPARPARRPRHRRAPGRRDRPLASGPLPGQVNASSAPGAGGSGGRAVSGSTARPASRRTS
ncbi:hypothetical protein GCM10020220_098200 [Nonomuraea rubra]|uniref:TetR/AcrR family transcriptional regulator n=1 Tax=Nonomuraea rubra TaxID=46180 RepID=UPI0031ECA4F7